MRYKYINFYSILKVELYYNFGQIIKGKIITNKNLVINLSVIYWSVNYWSVIISDQFFNLKKLVS